MKRAPTTFSLVLGLIVLALLLALGLSAALSTRARLRAMGDTYGQLVVATVISADALAMQDSPGAMQALSTLRHDGVRFEDGMPPMPRVRTTPLLRELGRSVGRRLGDQARVVVTQAPEPQIWVRSAGVPGRWIVLQAASYREQVVRSTLALTLLAGLIALGVAGLAARVLTRPLERLSAGATELLAGDPMTDRLRGSPREVHQLAAAIGAAGERQRELAGERELMLAGISHDLRTPLARLRLALELGDADDPQRRQAMVADLEELDHALEQCLAFVREGRYEPRREVDLATLVGQLLALRVQPDQWHYVGPSQALAWIRPSLVRRALANLMDNAEKYGAAPFEVVIEPLGHRVVLRIEDRGPGVPDELLPRLGRPFVRGHPARGGSAGSGLGLSIAMRAAELEGGRLQLSNREGGGFAAALDLARQPAAG